MNELIIIMIKTQSTSIGHPCFGAVRHLIVVALAPDMQQQQRGFNARRFFLLSWPAMTRPVARTYEDAADLRK